MRTLKRSDFKTYDEYKQAQKLLWQKQCKETLFNILRNDMVREWIKEDFPKVGKDWVWCEKDKDGKVVRGDKYTASYLLEFLLDNFFEQDLETMTSIPFIKDYVLKEVKESMCWEINVIQDVIDAIDRHLSSTYLQINIDPYDYVDAIKDEILKIAKGYTEAEALDVLQKALKGK